MSCTKCGTSSKDYNCKTKPVIEEWKLNKLRAMVACVCNCVDSSVPVSCTPTQFTLIEESAFRFAKIGRNGGTPQEFDVYSDAMDWEAWDNIVLFGNNVNELAFLNPASIGFFGNFPVSNSPFDMATGMSSTGLIESFGESMSVLTIPLQLNDRVMSDLSVREETNTIEIYPSTSIGLGEDLFDKMSDESTCLKTEEKIVIHSCGVLEVGNFSSSIPIGV